MKLTTLLDKALKKLDPKITFMILKNVYIRTEE